MIIIGYILAILVGVSLGLVGSGGSILTIPILVYVVGIAPFLTTTYSLFIVGLSASVGTIKAIQDKLLDYKTALLFGLPSIFFIFLMRKFMMPILPADIFRLGSFVCTKDLLIMLVFAVLMVLASFAMIRQTQPDEQTTGVSNHQNILLQGAFVGILTGFVGVGGGFLIIPTLVFSARLEMKKAVATSLIIVAINSFIGFFSGLHGQLIDWSFLLTFSLFATVGIVLGMFLAQYVSNEKLKPAFGWFILLMGIYIIIKEIFFNTKL